jgi:hypothetical protein
MRLIGLFILASTLTTVGCSGNVEEPIDCAAEKCDETSTVASPVEDHQQRALQARSGEPDQRPALSDEEKAARRPDRTKLPQ